MDIAATSNNSNSNFARYGRPRQAVILAGGRGSRLAPLTDTRSKAMIEFHGKPFLEYIVELLKEQGFERVLLLLGYKAESIIDHFGDGSRVGMDISYSVSSPDDLTVRRMQIARDRIEDSFLLMYCDNYWPLDMNRMWARFETAGVPAMVTVYSNPDRYSRDSVIVGSDGLVKVYDRGRTMPGLSGIEIGYAILTRPVLDLLPEDDALFEEAVYPKLTARRQLAAWVTDHRYYSVGSHERLPLTAEFFSRRPTVLLDRDGVLNRKPARAEYVRTWADFEWMPGALDALALLHRSGCRTIVISNQAGVARGAMTADDLGDIHRRMLEVVRQNGGEIDAIYTCMHGWDEGCACRKPKPGMFFQAQREFSFDLSRAVYIGDDERDGTAAEAAGCRFLMASESNGILEQTKRFLEGEQRHLCATK
jgi:D-glycero-D-manno-heptose 1,7-bisphosphate phosphatase